MSEYWKSTPKYWCKYCSTYVKDTPLEKTNHEASPRHQGNLKRSLRDLHRNNERAEREKQYAKAEAARLNGTGSGAGQQQANGDGMFKTTVNFTKTTPKSASLDDRKRQVAQLAALGVAVPDDFRRENAMVGDWQVTAQKITWENDSNVKKEEDPDMKPALNSGTRKRRTDEVDEVEEFFKAEDDQKQPRYGRTRGLPNDDDDDELNALLNSTTDFIRKVDKKIKKEVKEESNDEENAAQINKAVPEVPAIHVKKEADEDGLVDAARAHKTNDDDPAPADDGAGSIFKKRKRPPTKK